MLRFNAVPQTPGLPRSIFSALFTSLAGLVWGVGGTDGGFLGYVTAFDARG